jgi:hypothetical protein
VESWGNLWFPPDQGSPRFGDCDYQIDDRVFGVGISVDVRAHLSEDQLEGAISWHCLRVCPKPVAKKQGDTLIGCPGVPNVEVYLTL